MTDAQLITLGYRYERANSVRAKALRFCFDTAIKLTKTAGEREHYIHNFNQGRHEARMQVGRQEIRGAQ